MNTPSSNDTPSNQRVTLLIIWSAILFSVLTYCLLAVLISDTPGRMARPDPLQGALQYLPYLLPLAALVTGLGAYNAIALSEDLPDWKRTKTGFITMLAIFESNVIVGLVLFFLGMPVAKFFLFAATTVILLSVGLWRLMTTWPREG